ncbi:MAG: nucleoside phosphorylase [Cytophagales bacterium]|jgi:uridine phosphorylase|nr:nucleoside phosphorylase [Cytophagales bacterium]MCA6380436.1 nucleoside phosphorylase [Cytophagales bacterium]MCA6389537.1 nucleoside phosphorylase [Cytophagales bacterium]MCA6392661.1 nucleoside phosphorylase [Cytophagales bacterium]MCA6396760.1 nucleoside phosphorylase [Cytophagales bacterium]
MPKYTETDLILNKDGSVYHLNLLPKHISDTVIAVGDPSRVYMISQLFDEVEFEMNKREFITHVGKYNEKKITVISTGIGTDNIEIFFTELDALVNIDLKTREPRAKRKKLKVIRIGTSGALQEDIAVGSHLVSDYAVGFDNLMNFYDLPMDDFETGLAHDIQKKIGLPFMPYVARGSESLRKQLAFDMQVGNTVTCPGFYAPQGRELRVPIRFPKLLEDLNYYHKGDFWLTNFEMETAAYYAMGRLLGHEVLSVNAIIANRMKNKFSKDHTKVVESLIEKVIDRI